MASTSAATRMKDAPKSKSSKVWYDSKIDPELGKARLLIAKHSDLNAHVMQPGRFKLALIKEDESLSEAASLRPSLVEGLRAAFKICELNALQRKVLPAALQPGSRVLCAGETGSGKTLAYLLPILHKLKAEEDTSIFASFVGSPRALVLVPSAELAQQVGAVTKLLSHHAKLRTGHLTKGTANTERLFGTPLDLLVTTPKQVLNAVQEGAMNLDSLRHLALDEADCLLTDDTFGTEVQKLLASPTAMASKLLNQLDTLLMASASISEAFKTALSARPCKIIASEALHRPLRSNRYDFLQVDGPGDARLKACIELLEKHKELPTLIFCNSTTSATLLHTYLEKHYLRTAQTSPGLLHGWIPEPQRQALLTHARSNNLSVICTDVLARGLDTTDWIRHVILYDFPQSPLQFLHRAGRAGRAGRRGRVSCLVTAKDKRMAEYIRLSITRGSKLGAPL